jgi:hypothetical protein
MYRLNITNGGLSRVRIAAGRGQLELLNGRLD